jgi:hypothetical protein
MPHVYHPLQNGFIANWLVAGPQSIPVSFAQFSAPSVQEPATQDITQQILQHHWEPKSGITRRPVERGPLETGRFQLGDYTGSWSYHRCPEDHFVDQSAFYPTLHYLRSWAYIELVSAIPQDATFALTTCGAATIWLGRELAFRSNSTPAMPAAPLPDLPPSLNIAQPLTHTFTAHLKKGPTPLLVRFEAVGARQTAHAFSLRICRSNPDGTLSPAEDIRACFGTLIPRLGRRNAFELLSAATFVERDVYEGATPIAICWPEGPRGFCPTHVRLQDAEDFIYVLGDSGGAPGDRLDLVSALQLPAGPLHATLMPSPDEYYRENVRISHTIPLWSLGLQRYAASPTGDLSSRRTEALLAAARTEHSPFAQIARMALEAWADVESMRLLASIEAISHREAGSNLTLLALLGMLYRFGDRPRFPSTIHQPLEEVTLAYRYSLDDLGQDIMDFESETDRFLFHTSELLAGQRYPDRIFATGQSGSWHRERGRRRALEWMTTFSTVGSACWGSPDAIERTIVALSHIADLAEDQQTYELAAVSLDKLLFMLAANSFRGVLATASQDAPALSAKSGLLQPTAGISRFLWGTGIFNHHVAGVVSLATAAGYELPLMFEAIAHDAPDSLLSRERHAPPTATPADLVIYKTPDYALSSIQDYRPDQHGQLGHPGTCEQIWRATLSAEATVFATHPGSSSESESRAPGFWAGNAALPRVAQWQDALISIHHIPPESSFTFTHAYFPTATFDEYVVRDNWAFARSGDGYLALTNTSPLTLTAEGRYAHRELRVTGPSQGWIVQMGRAALDGDFATFQDKVSALPLQFEEISATANAHSAVHFTTLRGDKLSFSWDGPLTVNGTPHPLHGTHHIENPYATAGVPCTHLEIRHAGQGLGLDFTAP